ncbi:MAG: hypothetical protein MUF25_21825 [Pirellulaceae bacterium]|nr:hypothetical protein [Pirellulaceae bacterium]
MLSSILILGLSAACCAAPPETSGGRAVSVRPIDRSLLAPRVTDPRAVRLVQAYYDSILRWGRIVAAQARPLPNRAEAAYLGLGGHQENDVRPTAYAAMVAAFLAVFEPPSGGLPEAERRQMRSKAISLLRYMTSSHGSSGGRCPDGKPWGQQWQSAMWARAVGMAAWLIWSDLDQPLQAATQRMIEAEADRFLNQGPKSRVAGDTGAEENAWNAQLISLSANMFAGHPREAAWDEAAKRYMYNSFSVAADDGDQRLGDDGRTIADWVTTINARDDFLVENHGLTHVGYLKTTASELQENAVHYLLAARPVPNACSHHVREVFQVLLASMAWDASPVFFGGNDWKLFHTQASDVVVYAMLNLLAGDRHAARLEQLALEWLTRIQQAEHGYYNVRRDPEYGGLCATRLIACCLAHSALGPGVAPASDGELDQAASGVRYLASAEVILHRTPTKFASFAWANKRMALALPRDGNWVVWPHFASYLGVLDGEEPTERTATLETLRTQTRPDGFQITGTLSRCGGRLKHDFFFASPAEDLTVFVERLRPQAGFRLTQRETGVVGLEYELGTNRRRLHGEFGTLTATGYGGRARVHAWTTNWLNIDDRVGYVICRSAQPENVIRFHDETEGSGRVPQLQEWLSLIGEADSADERSDDWACLVTFLNQTAKATAAYVPRIRFTVQNDTARCYVAEAVFAVDFRPEPLRRSRAPNERGK